MTSRSTDPPSSGVATRSPTCVADSRRSSATKLASGPSRYQTQKLTSKYRKAARSVGQWPLLPELAEPHATSSGTGVRPLPRRAGDHATGAARRMPPDDRGTRSARAPPTTRPDSRDAGSGGRRRPRSRSSMRTAMACPPPGDVERARLADGQAGGVPQHDRAGHARRARRAGEPLAGHDEPPRRRRRRRGNGGGRAALLRVRRDGKGVVRVHHRPSSSCCSRPRPRRVRRRPERPARRSGPAPSEWFRVRTVSSPNANLVSGCARRRSSTSLRRAVEQRARRTDGGAHRLLVRRRCGRSRGRTSS